MPNAAESNAPWTIGRLLDWTTQWFRERNVEGGRLATELLLAHALGCRKIELYTRFESEPTEEQKTAFRELVRRAGQHTPIAYLLGRREFFSLEFEVTPAVLIPRPETEALVQRAIDICRKEPERTWRVLDIGTGTGCIASAIAHYAKNTMLVASDISPEAIAVAAANVQRHQLAERVRLIQADCADLPAEVRPEDGFDIVACNPPYISDEAFATLPPNVREHEPRLALLGPGGDGLAMYRRLAAEVPPILAPGGLLLVEIAYDQSGSVLDLFKSDARWSFAGAHRNRTDPYDRVLEFRVAAPAA